MRHLKKAAACDLGYMTDHAKKIAQGVQQNLSDQADKELTTLDAHVEEYKKKYAPLSSIIPPTFDTAEKLRARAAVEDLTYKSFWEKVPTRCLTIQNIALPQHPVKKTGRYSRRRIGNLGGRT